MRSWIVVLFLALAAVGFGYTGRYTSIYGSGGGSATTDYPYTYTRATTSYDSEGTSYAIDEYITRDFVLTSKLTLGAGDSSNPTAGVFYPQCETDNYLWATQGTTGYVWRKAKGTGDWTDVHATAGINYDAIWSNHDDINRTKNLLIFIKNDGTGYISDDEGATYTAINTPVAPTSGSTGTKQTQWGCAFNGDTVVYVEYDNRAGVKTGFQIVRSTNAGLDFSLVYTHTPLNAAATCHFHCVGYHAATGKWAAFIGDASNKTVVMSSAASNGEEWTPISISTVIPPFQPVRALDVGDSSHLVCFDDSFGGVVLFNMVTETFYTPASGTFLQRFAGDQFFWGGYNNSGTLYALGIDLQASAAYADRNSVYVSLDKGMTWTPCFQRNLAGTTDESTGFSQWVAGYSSGNLYLRMSGDVAEDGCSMLTLPENIATRTFVLVEDSVTNIITTEAKSTINTLAATGPAGEPTESLVSEPSLFSTAYVNITKGSESGDIWGYVTVEDTGNALPCDGSLYCTRWFVKGDTGMAALSLRTNHHTTEGLANQILYGITNPSWQEILGGLSVSRYDATDRIFYNYIQFGGSGTSAYYTGSSFDLDLGGIVISPYRGHFAVGGTPVAKTSLSRQFAVGTDWTVVETIIPDLPVQMYDQYGIWAAGTDYPQNSYVQYDADADGEYVTYKSSVGDPTMGDVPGTDEDWGSALGSWKWHIMTLSADADNKIVVYLDTALVYSSGTRLDGLRIKADVWQGGAKDETLTIAAPFAFQRFSPINIGITCDNNAGSPNIEMYVRFADGVLRHSGDGTNTGLITTGGDYTDLQSCTITESFTGEDNTNTSTGYMPQMCSWVLENNNKIYDTAYDDTEIDADMNVVREATGSGSSGAVYKGLY